MTNFNFKIQTNKPKNIYEIIINNVNNNLVISVLQIDSLPVKKYQNYFDLKYLKKLNKFFTIYDNIDEILEELEARIKDSLIIKEDNNLILKFKLNNKKYKEAIFKINEITDKDDIILELFYKIKELKEKNDINEKIEKINLLNKKIEEKNKIIENLNKLNSKKDFFIISETYQYQILSDKKNNFNNEIKIEKSNEFDIKSKNINNSLFDFKLNNNSIKNNESNSLFGNNIFNKNNNIFNNIKSNNNNFLKANETKKNLFNDNLFSSSNNLFNNNNRNNFTNIFYSANSNNSNDSFTTLNTTLQDEENDYTVYVTNTGRKYHSKYCSYLRSSCIPKKLSHVRNCYSPCSRCCP